ncbi:hypothetical protein SAMN02745146_1306 [Hymenobacter daecheongensis DSM 21074]|uniref:Fibronectin type-III domain-containing protein n=1 Tax=Hymenobacter daecheongensis DSM 21074 TaxID=1121955 RepID=A0A1M6CXD9_9BACT|nr:hypothetical protein [Hymenobacter daecheongensis]SHI65692.1 hypothetical protein SAMN02745146_1306 [Hymenobacter daecheongensis DSM 21074]
MVRKTSLAAVLLLLLGVSLALGATITLFQASFDGTNVRVDWEVTNEAGVDSYEIWRKANNEPSFGRLTTVAPTAQRRYQFLDTNVYRGVAGTTSGGPFTYRLTVRTTTGDQNYTTVLNPTPSAVQRSWGSIKSMFR